ncbi:MAG: L-aspartate oxidase [Bacteroidetes bacterium HGW-Bacteroidetes-10]|nr:MAG: L-aspartate oxidase [Bacteroidetes bacterium HGW-Bacteroidetes-10]
MHQFDYIIVGSGLAGLYSAYRASRYGKVALITKSGIRESNSYFAQGGIAAVTDEEDATEFHFEDTIIAGRGICDHDAVNILVNEGPERIRELIEEGMEFDMQNGALALGLEGGHHRRRILHAGGDVTGKKITDFMIEKVSEHHNIAVFENLAAIEILKKDGVCCGVRTWDLKEKKEVFFTGRHTILAMGGASAIYKNTTNPATTTGDGVALAYRADCKIADMEFIQFHPTSIYTEEEKSYLISEAVRGEGAQLVNVKGERFMPDIHENAELAPRDIVARSIYKQIRQQREPFVYLTLNHLNPERIKARFPNIFARCASLGIDMSDRIPVAPAAHYMVGGVKSDLWGRSSVPHLFVCGELASTGIMGANRLASNSLLECLVFGYRAVEECSREADKERIVLAESELSSIYRSDSAREKEFCELSSRVSEIMTLHAGIIRNEKLLAEGLAKLEKERANFVMDGKEIFELMGENLIIVAELIIRSALERRESRGGHYREDFPEENDKFIHHIVQQRGKGISALPVNKTL